MAARTHRRRRFWRWTRRIALSLAALAVTLIASAVIVIHTDYGRELIREQIENTLQGMFSGGARLGSFEGSPFGRIVLRDLRINSPDGRQVIGVKALSFEPHLLPLLTKRARLDDVIVDDADVLIERDARGQIVIAQLFPRLGWSIDLPSVSVHRAHITVATGDNRYDFDAIEVAGSFRSPVGAPREVAAVINGHVRQRDVPFSLDVVARSTDPAAERALEIPTAIARLGNVVVTARAVRMTPASPNRLATFAGHLTVSASRTALAELVPTLDVPVDLSASIDVTSDESTTHLMISASADGHPLLAGVDVAIGEKRARGWLATGTMDLTVLSRRRLRGTASVIALFDVTASTAAPSSTGFPWPTGRVLMHAAGDVEGVVGGSVAIAATSDVQGVLKAVVSAAAPGMSATARGEVRHVGDALVLHEGELVARGHGDGSSLFRGVRGDVSIDLKGSGQLAPRLDVAATGTVVGEQLHRNGVSIGAMRMAIDARGLPYGPRGHVVVDASDVKRGRLELRTVAVKAATRDDGRLAVSLRARPAAAASLVEVDALVGLPHPRAPSFTVELSHHRLRVRGIEWTGTKGRLVLGRKRIEISDLVTASTGGHDRVAVSAVLSPPTQITNVDAWRRLDRSALRHAHVTVERLDLKRMAELAGLGGNFKGHVDGVFQASPSAMEGHLSIRDAILPAFRGHGALHADIDVSQAAGGELEGRVAARIGTISGIDAQARIKIPRHAFDRAAWTRRVLSSASVRIAELELEPSLLERFAESGQSATVDSLARYLATARGRVTLVGEVSEGAQSAKLAVNVTGLVVGPLVRPVDVDLEATIDDKAAVATLQVRSDRERLVDVAATIGVSLGALIGNPRAGLAATLDTTATLPPLAVPKVLALFGRTAIADGTIAGDLKIGGTVQRPTLRAHVVVDGIRYLERRRNEKAAAARTLTMDATWDGSNGSIVIDGSQQDGMLRVSVTGSPWALRNATAIVEARTFDLSPLLMLAPGPIGAATGQLDGTLSIKGLDTRTTKIAGQLQLSRAQVPIDPAVGTLRNATLDLVARESKLLVRVDGKLGGGTIKAKATIGLDGASPVDGDVTVELRKVSPIGIVEPDIDADVTAKLRQVDRTWIADVAITNGRVTVPMEAREALKPVGAPDDMRFTPVRRVVQRPGTRVPQARPILIANVVLHPMHVLSDDLRSVVKGKLTLTTDGAAIGIVGTIHAERGDLDLFGRRYRVERATVSFDGSDDPLIDVRIEHDFSDVTTITLVRGRVSKPELVMSSDPATYSQGQLLGFLLGGEPQDDPATGSLKDSASGAGTSIVAAKVASYMRRALPIDLDVLRYEAATSTSSGTFTVGSWVTRRLFLGYRSRPAARSDENFGEAHIEYWLSPRVNVEAAGGDRGYSGVDLLWRKRY